MAKVTMNTLNQAVAKAILNQQGEAPRWGVVEHASAVRNVACKALDAAGIKPTAEQLKAFRATFFTSLNADGLAGNASQFRQRLVANDLLAKSEDEAVAGYE